MRFRENNIYDIVLTALVALLVFGSIGNGAQPVRLAILGLSPFMLMDAFRGRHASLEYYRYECFFLAFWWTVGLTFLYRSMEMAESVKHLIYLFIHITGFLEVLWLACRARNPQRAICRGWIILLLITVPIAVWEITGGTHLPTTIMDDQSIGFGKIRVERPYAAITFGNLNSYNTVVVWALPYLFFWSLFPQKGRDSLVALLTFLPILLIVVINSSRGAIISLAAMFMIYVACYMRVGRYRTALMSIVTVVTFVLAYYLYEMFFFIIGRFTDQGMEDDGRTENIVKGLQAFFDSGCMGIGIGNYEPVMGRIYDVMIPAPHNLFLEIIVVFGIFVFIGFLGAVLRLFLISRRGEQRNRFFFAFAIVALGLGGIVDSGYWMKATTWFYFVCMYVLVDSRYNPRVEPSDTSQITDKNESR